MNELSELDMSRDVRSAVQGHDAPGFLPPIDIEQLKQRGIRKISVVGAGAIGTFVGGMIAAKCPGIQVVLLGRGDHCQAMRDRGRVRLQGLMGEHEVPIQATNDWESICESDLVLLTVKTQDTETAAIELRDLIDKEMLNDAIFVSIQNGINQRILQRYLPANRLIVGMTATNMTTTAAGVVSMQRNGVSIIGAAHSEMPRELVDLICQTLGASGMRFEATDRIVGFQYNKLLLNSIGYASAMSATDFVRDGLLHRQWRNAVAAPLLDEGLRTLAAAGVKLQKPSDGSNVVSMRRLLRVLNVPIVTPVARSVVRLMNPPRIVFSLQYDLARCHRTEIDFVNGEIVQLAHEHGITAPLNAEVVRAVHELEQRADASFFSRQQVIERFASLQR